MFIAIEKNIHVKKNTKQITDMLKGNIRFSYEKGAYIEYSPKKVFGNYAGEEVVKVFYRELDLKPFTDTSKYNDGDEVTFIKESYDDNGEKFYFAEIVEC